MASTTKAGWVAAGLLAGLSGCAGGDADSGLLSRPGEYAGYSEAEYDGHELSSFYVEVRDGTRLAMDLFRPTRAGVVEEEPLPVVCCSSGRRRTAPGAPFSRRPASTCWSRSCASSTTGSRGSRTG